MIPIPQNRATHVLTMEKPWQPSDPSLALATPSPSWLLRSTEGVLEHHWGSQDIAKEIGTKTSEFGTIKLWRIFPTFSRHFPNIFPTFSHQPSKMRLGLKMLGKSSKFFMVDSDFHHEIAVFFGGRNGLPMSFATIIQDVQCEPASPRTQLQSIPFTVRLDRYLVNGNMIGMSW